MSKQSHSNPELDNVLGQETAKHTSEVTANYVTVRPFLVSIGARCMWSGKGPQDTGIKSMECWLLGRTLVVFSEYKIGGWEYFIQADANKIADCCKHLAAIARATGEAA